MSIYAQSKQLNKDDSKQLRKEAGIWLRSLREARRLSQRQLANRVDVEYYTFISQIEVGRGRVPTERVEIWAEALGEEVQPFAKRLMSYYDPINYRWDFPETNIKLTDQRKN